MGNCNSVDEERINNTVEQPKQLSLKEFHEWVNDNADSDSDSFVKNTPAKTKRASINDTIKQINDRMDKYANNPRDALTKSTKNNVDKHSSSTEYYYSDSSELELDSDSCI
jgi:t-SNARE complex subunit (syntaxin)